MLLTKIRLKRLSSSLILALLTALAPAAIATAVCSSGAQSCSSNFQVTESYFGNGGQYLCSGSYCAKQTSGENAVGQSCDPSDAYCTQAGFNTDRAPYLEFVINPPTDVNVGILDTTETHVGTASFSIKTYLAQGYQVTTESLPPKTSGHTFATPGSHTVASPGTELFGMNLVGNTCPGSVPGSGSGSCPNTSGAGTLGADPFCDPSNFCNYPAKVTIPANYSTANQYYYPASGSDTIISSSSSTGVTTFTLSYIFNISNLTPAGTYRMNQDLVATSTF